MFSSLANGILVVNTKNELKIGEGEGSVTPKKNDIRSSGPAKEEWSSHMVHAFLNRIFVVLMFFYITVHLETVLPFAIWSLSAIFKTRIQQMRTWIQRMRRTWCTWRIWQTRRIWWIHPIQRTRRIRQTPRIRRIRWIQRIRLIPYAIFKRFFSFIYSATKYFMSSCKLSSELYLAEAWATNKY